MKNQNCPRSTSRRDGRSNGPFSGRQLDLRRSEGVLEISWGGLTMSERRLACLRRCRVIVADVAVGRTRVASRLGRSVMESRSDAHDSDQIESYLMIPRSI
jgi:hypothetical protein